MAKAVLQKEWYTLVAPGIFDKQEVGTTPAEESELVGGRTIKVNLKDLMPSTSKYYMDVYLQVEEVEGDTAQTRIAGHDISNEYLSKMIRRYSNRVDAVEDVQTADGETVRVKLVATTIRKTNSATVKDLRKEMIDVVEEQAADLSLAQFMKRIFAGDLQDEVEDAARQIYPLRELEVRKTEVK